MKFRREIEKKYVVSNYGNYRTLLTYVDTLLEPWRKENGVSKDVFWKHEGVDFIRLRENTLELTTKVTDKEDIVDRVEENLVVASFEDGMQWANTVFGESAGEFKKEYTVLYTANAIVSVYRVLEDNEERVFLEVESDTLEKVNLVCDIMNEHLSLKQEYRSLFQIFFDKYSFPKKELIN